MIKKSFGQLTKSKNYLFLNTGNFILNFIIYYIFKISYWKINRVRIYYSIFFVLYFEVYYIKNTEYRTMNR